MTEQTFTHESMYDKAGEVIATHVYLNTSDGLIYGGYLYPIKNTDGLCVVVPVNKVSHNAGIVAGLKELETSAINASLNKPRVKDWTETCSLDYTIYCK